MLAEKFVFYSLGSKCLSEVFVMPPELCLRKIRLTLVCQRFQREKCARQGDCSGGLSSIVF